MNAPTLPFPAQEPYTGPRTGDQLAGLAHLERIALEQAEARMALPGPRHRRVPAPWRRRLRLSFPLLVSFAVCLSLVTGASASGHPRYYAPVCGRSWVPVNLGSGDYLNVYNEPDGQSCVRVQDGRNGNLSWYVSYRTPGDENWWQYPMVSSGLLWGKYTCYDGKSGLKSSPGSRCMRYPVQVRHDGYPRTSVTYWPHLAAGNVSYDIWFNKEAVPESRFASFGQADGAEIMIWLAHPGTGFPSWRYAYHVKILGRWYGVVDAVSRHHGVTWTYIAYVAMRQTRTLPPTWLNYFFRDSAKHRALSMDWWLTSINFGAEMNPGTLPDGAESGTGFAVKSYTLTGVK